MFNWLRTVIWDLFNGRQDRPRYHMTLGWDAKTEQRVEGVSRRMRMERAEVFRRALALYDMLTEMREVGHLFMAIDREGNWKRLSVVPKGEDTYPGTNQPTTFIPAGQQERTTAYTPAGPEGSNTDTSPG